MSDTYVKLFSSITASTIWQAPAPTRLVWITMLAMSDKSGCVYASVPGLAHIANVGLQETELALEMLLSPDKYSRTTDNEGRRIEPIDGGWRLLNHAKFRAMRGAEERREYMRDYMRGRRATGDPLAVLAESTDVTPPAPAPTPSQDEAQGKEHASRRAAQPKKRATRLPEDWMPTEELMSWASAKRPGIDLALEVERFRDFWIAKPGKDGTKLDWSATWRNWIRNARIQPVVRQAQGPPPGPTSKYGKAMAGLEQMKNDDASVDFGTDATASLPWFGGHASG